MASGFKAETAGLVIDRLGLVRSRCGSSLYQAGEVRQWATADGRYLLRQTKGLAGVRWRKTNGRPDARFSLLAGGPGGRATAVLSTHLTLAAALAALERRLVSDR